jgi:hypothetical protein
VEAGGRVQLVLRVSDRHGRPCTLLLGGKPPFDFEVLRGARLVWNWAHGRTVLLVLDSARLGPGERLTYEAEWDTRDNQGRPVPPGTYWVRGVLRLDYPRVARSRLYPLQVR